jgi:two-component system, NarL family, response regulator NreC
MAASETIRVLIADDHQIVRDGLLSLLEKEADIQVVGIAKEGRTALKMVQDLAPQVVVMDVSMPDLNGIEATHLIRKDFPEVKVIALSMHTAPRFVINMIQAGAAGYLIKDCAFRELSEAIRLVAIKNQIYLSPGITGIVVQKCLTNSFADSPFFTDLSSREREVLQLIAEGMKTVEIAKHLFVSVKTVESHRSTIFMKLKIDSIAELTKFALREGITSLE